MCAFRSSGTCARPVLHSKASLKIKKESLVDYGKFATKREVLDYS